MAVLIDSSVLISWERRGVSPRTLVDDMGEDAAIAAVTLSELMVGVHRAATAEQRTRRQAFVDQIIDTMAVLPFDLNVALVYAGLWTELFQAGQRIGAFDAMIAATALSYDHQVPTENLREFARVPGLVVRTPLH